MKINKKVGDLFSVTEGHIAHGCNAQGVMGSGVAATVKELYPAAFKSYREIFLSTTGLELGVAYPVRIDKLVIWNAITQENFGSGMRHTSYDAIETCFSNINAEMDKFKAIILPELHIPLIGCDRGGAKWEIVESIIENTVDFPVTLWIYNGTKNK